MSAPFQLTIVGDPAAAACVGDSCLIPGAPVDAAQQPTERALVNQRLDEDLV